MKMLTKNQVKEYTQFMAESVLDNIEEDIGIYFYSPIQDKVVKAIRNSLIKSMSDSGLVLSFEDF